MKTKSLTLILSLSVTSLVMACPSGNKNGRKHRVEHHANFIGSLSLSTDQRKQFETIMTNKSERMHEVMANIHEDTQAKLAKILSAEQMARLADKKGKRRSKGTGRLRNK